MYNEKTPTFTAQEQLEQLFHDEWEARLQEEPLFATFTGDHRYNDRLPVVTIEAMQERVERATAFLDRLRGIDRATLSAEGQLNYDIFERELQNRIAEFGFGVHYMPVDVSNGPQAFMADLLQMAPFKNIRDYENYLQRLNGVKDYFEGLVELMRTGVREGYTPAGPALKGVEESFSALAAPPVQESVFYQPFLSFPHTIPAKEQARLEDAGQRAIQEVVAPALEMIRRFIKDEYAPAARLDIAASSLPGGMAFYEYCIRRYTTLEFSAGEVHQLGLEEVARIRAEMEAAKEQAGFSGDLRQFIEFLRTDPRFFVDTPAQLMKEVALIMKKIDGELPRLFKKLPRTPYGLREIPAHMAPYSTTAYYFPPPGDLAQAGFYYVNTYDLPSRPLYEYEALSLHEAVPGHHLQIAYQLELQNVPDFRRYSDMTSYVEGWALYAERLGLEVGFYQDPYTNFGRLIFEIWRAVRLVVDTGMHAMGWTRQQAIDYMAENTALSMLNIENEVDRYISWPGQALAYKIGEIKVRALRAYAEQQLGEAFDLREFHDRLLETGGIPLDVLEARLQQWVADQAQG